ncbi:MAG: polymer-forming cytoskeletal protein [Mariprofundaceae bacterium]|nr:polymer-forming cytoskeletal protein [Mariprofundaceae bacterium]
MFKKENPAPTGKEPQHIDTLIGAHSVFTGELSFEGAVRIDGRFEGNIHSEKDGTLIVSEGAHIKGEVDVPNLVLHGDINGNVRAGNSLRIGCNGILNGDVEYKIITLAEGSAINGRCARIEEKAQPNKTKNIKKDAAEPIQVK